jgi:hypothetical protein
MLNTNMTPDQMSAAASYIAREWGDYGYSIENVESPTHAVSLFHVRALDGSRFVVAADKWGNTGGPVDSHGYASPERTTALDALVARMHAAATAA